MANNYIERVLQSHPHRTMSPEAVDERLAKLRKSKDVTEYLSLSLLRSARQACARRISYSDPAND